MESAMRRTCRSCVLAFTLVLCAALVAWATPVEPQIDGLCHAVFTNPNGPGGAVAVMINGETVHEQCYGQSPDPKHPGAVTPTTPFYLASVSKQFTALCIMILAEQGKLGLDDDIRKHLPEFPRYNEERPIFIEDLLTMRSGLKEYPMDEPSVTRKDLTAWYATQELETPTGTQYEYCNGGYVLLGFIVEQASGLSMKDFLKQNVFGPLKMTHTTFLDGDTADAGVISCLEDMMIYEQALRNSPLVTAEMMQRAWTPAQLDNGHAIEYGYGWNVSAEHSNVYHTGKWTGASTYFSLDPDSGVSIIVLSGIDDTVPPLAEAIDALEEP